MAHLDEQLESGEFEPDAGGWRGVPREAARTPLGREAQDVQGVELAGGSLAATTFVAMQGLPLLGTPLAAYVEAPTPYLMGSSRALIDAQHFDLSTVFVVDLDRCWRPSTKLLALMDDLQAELAKPLPPVAPGAVWVRGDCDSVSVDSRIWGDLDRRYLVGRPTFRLWPPARIGPL